MCAVRQVEREKPKEGPSPGPAPAHEPWPPSRATVLSQVSQLLGTIFERSVSGAQETELEVAEVTVLWCTYSSRPTSPPTRWPGSATAEPRAPARPRPRSGGCAPPGKLPRRTAANRSRLGSVASYPFRKVARTVGDHAK